MKTGHALVSGSAGAATMTLAHEILRQLTPVSPRLEKLGMDGISRLMRAVGLKPPRGEKLRAMAMVGDLVSNALWFAPIAARRRITPWQGALLGAATGLGAVVLGPKLGFPRRYSGKRRDTQLMTVGLYALAGFAAATVGKLVGDSSEVSNSARPRISELR